MGSSPKIMVFKLREIIYTLILAFFVITLLLCLILMFTKKSTNHTDETQAGANSTQSTGTEQEGTTEITDSEANPASSSANGTYIAGVYTSSVTLGDSAVDVQVTVSSDRILAIELVNLSEATEAAYPLVPSALENIASQILEKQKLDGITCSAQTRYTSQLLLNAVSKALSTAKAAENT
ncbi:MAG: hypothetical protein LUD16_00465 [Lachnospiraceae bacterium]|nr:hypothetical protein [Lachnospiraceae bacterium]